MACSTTIPICFINETGKNDFTVNIYASKYSREPWRSINAQSSATFGYDTSVEVGASYSENGLHVVSGPFPAEVGSVWQVKQDSPRVTAILSLVERQGAPDGTIIIKNQYPSSNWGGAKFDMGIYRNERRIEVKRGVHVGDQAVFCIPQTLYFSVTRNTGGGSCSCTEEITAIRAAFDMARYRCGLKVLLKETPGGGQYIFSGSALI